MSRISATLEVLWIFLFVGKNGLEIGMTDLSILPTIWLSLRYVYTRKFLLASTIMAQFTSILLQAKNYVLGVCFIAYAFTIYLNHP